MFAFDRLHVSISSYISMGVRIKDSFGNSLFFSCENLDIRKKIRLCDNHFGHWYQRRLDWWMSPRINNKQQTTRMKNESCWPEKKISYTWKQLHSSWTNKQITYAWNSRRQEKKVDRRERFSINVYLKKIFLCVSLDQ